MKDYVILILIGYIIYDRYVKEEKYELLKKDIQKVSEKINDLKQKI